MTPNIFFHLKIPTPDCYYDFSQGSNDDETRDTIKDYSGNGNDAVAHNFAWNEQGSGYKDGALVFDGVDDYVNLDAFDSGFKTMFMLCNPLYKKLGGMILYDQRKNTLEKYMEYAIFFNNGNFVAYCERNKYDTFINGMLNRSIKVNELINKKQLIYVLTNDEVQESRPTIGANATNSGYYSDMALYKFLGFKEALTEEQINAIIKKYNLLDGVDEIEVS